jgi:hypothetical protein
MMRAAPISSVPLVIACAVLLLVAAHAGPENADDAALGLRGSFEQGNALYEKGDYDGAVAQYETLVAAGVRDEHLFYNLGNAYYKTNNLGRSVLFYERALRLAPRDKDVRANLTLLRTQLQDRQFVREQNWVVGTIVWLHDNLNTREMLLFTSVSFVLMCILLITFVFKDTRPVRGVYNVVSILSPGRLAGLSRAQDLAVVIIVIGCLFVTSGVSSFYKVKDESSRNQAVVLEREIPVYSSPTDDATLQFKIHEGTLVMVRQQRSQWVRIGLPGGLSGWVSARAVARI